MAAMIRPSLILQMDLDERAFSDETVAEIKRSYSYVAPSTVATHAPDGDSVQNVMRFRIKLRKPYWDKSDADAEALWSGVMPTWLRNMFYKVSSTIVASNKTHRDQGKPELVYDWIELEFGENALVAVRTAADSSIPEEAVGWVEQVRDLMNAGALGEGVPTCVRIPSRASWERQCAAGLETARAADATEASEGVDDIDAASAGPAPAPELFTPPFDVDYTVWGVEFPDGTVREFDSTASAFIS